MFRSEKQSGITLAFERWVQCGQEIEAMGKKFDTASHEALMVEETPEKEDGTVLEVFQKGFKLGDRVVRTAKVKVSKKS